MKFADVLKVHQALYSNDDFVEYDGQRYAIRRLQKQGSYYAACFIGNRAFRTQNLAKPSANTFWVKQSLDRQLTWIFNHPQGGYLGKVKRWIDRDSEHIEIWKFYPSEHVAYERVDDV